MAKVLNATSKTVNAIRWAHNSQINATSRNTIVRSVGGASASTSADYNGYFKCIANASSISIVDGSERVPGVCGKYQVGSGIINVSDTTLSLDSFPFYISLVLTYNETSEEYEAALITESTSFVATGVVIAEVLEGATAGSFTLYQTWTNEIIDFNARYWL